MSLQAHPAMTAKLHKIIFLNQLPCSLLIFVAIEGTFTEATLLICSTQQQMASADAAVPVADWSRFYDGVFATAYAYALSRRG